MSPRQQTYFFGHLWPQACERMGWDPKNNETRHTFFKVELGSPKSFRDFTQEDYDKIKARCLAITAPENLQAQLHQLSQPRLRMEHRLGELQRCLALYTTNPDAYEQRIIERRFLGRRPQDMPDDELLEYIQTLNARVNGTSGFRAKSRHTMHDMRTAAGLRCDCSACSRAESQKSLQSHPVP